MGKKAKERLRKMEERIELFEARVNGQLELIGTQVDFLSDGTERRMRSLRDEVRGDINLVVKGVANTNARLDRLQDPKGKLVPQKDILEILLPKRNS